MFQICAPHWNIYNSFPSFQLQQHRQSIIVLAFVACLDKIKCTLYCLIIPLGCLTIPTPLYIYQSMRTYNHVVGCIFWAHQCNLRPVCACVCSIRVCGTEPKKLAVVGPCTMHDCSVVGLQL